MSYKTILIKVDREPRFPRTLGAAVSLAQRCCAHVIALAMLPPRAAHAVAEASTDGADRSAVEAECERMRLLFERETQGRNVSGEWLQSRPDEDDDLRRAAARSHVVDLIVTGAPEMGWDSPVRGVMWEDLLMASGRPVLQVPRSGTQFAAPSRTLIAWNGSREAAWSTFAALPLLKIASSVKILTIVSGAPDEQDSVVEESHYQLKSALARHGVRAHSEAIAISVPEVGAALISAAKADNASLIVMGGYGHSRLGDLVLGATTGHMLRHSSVPILMSH